MGEASLWGAISVLLFGIAGGLVISAITARRLNAVGHTARAVMDGDLSQRVPVTGRGDEFDQLGLGLNAMLDRNEQLVASLGLSAREIDEADDEGQFTLEGGYLYANAGVPVERARGAYAGKSASEVAGECH